MLICIDKFCPNDRPLIPSGPPQMEGYYIMGTIRVPESVLDPRIKELADQLRRHIPEGYDDITIDLHHGGSITAGLLGEVYPYGSPDWENLRNLASVTAGLLPAPNYMWDEQAGPNEELTRLYGLAFGFTDELIVRRVAQ